MKQYDDERINNILSKLEKNIPFDDEYEYRDVNCDLSELYKNIDKIVEYVKNDFKGKLYVNSNIWNICYESMLDILKIYDLKLVPFEAVTEENEVVKVNDYIKNQFNIFGLNERTTDEQIQQIYENVVGITSENMSVKQKKKYLSNYLLNEMVEKYKISLEQKEKFEKEFFKNKDIDKER